MRKISQEAAQAFHGGREYRSGNTSVRKDGDIVVLALHGNDIARNQYGELVITVAGWNTNTTRERLNALLGVSVKQKCGVLFLNGKEWDGEWRAV